MGPGEQQPPIGDIDKMLGIEGQEVELFHFRKRKIGGAALLAFAETSL